MLNSLFKSYNRLCHFIVAKPIDILHSPFVFKLYQDAKAIHQKPDANVKWSRILTQLPVSKASSIASVLTALNAKHVYQLVQKPTEYCLQALGNTNAGTISLQAIQTPIDAIFIDKETDLKTLPLDVFKTLLNSECPLIINEPYHHLKSKHLWLQFVQQKEIQVAIDFFDFGLCFFNRKQAKEYFKLRLW
jgi:hypothetical protein